MQERRSSPFGETGGNRSSWSSKRRVTSRPSKRRSTRWSGRRPKLNIFFRRGPLKIGTSTRQSQEKRLWPRYASRWASQTSGTSAGCTNALVLVWAARRKVVAACDHSMPRRGHGRTGDSMCWWNEQLSVLRRKCLTARRSFTRSKGDPLLLEAWKRAKSALRQGTKKSRLQCWKDSIGEVEKDPWGLAFKIVTKRLVTRRKTPGLDNANRVKYIVRSLFPHVEPFQRQNRSSCEVRSEKLFTLEELKRAGGRLNANTAPGTDGLPNEILIEVIGVYPEILLEVFNSCLQEGLDR